MQNNFSLGDDSSSDGYSTDAEQVAPKQQAEPEQQVVPEQQAEAEQQTEQEQQAEPEKQAEKTQKGEKAPHIFPSRIKFCRIQFNLFNLT